ncbi:MAG: cytidine deaminase [Halorhabdus sp.]
MQPAALIDEAHEARDNAYVPYSEYPVGAALETASGEVYQGFNVEIVNYSNSFHAEELAVMGAIRDGHTDFERVAVVSGEHDGVTPCGMCRQTFAEFCTDAFEIYTEDSGTIKAYTLGELLPEAMKPGNLQDRD